MTLTSELKTTITADTSGFTKGITKAKQEAAAFSSQVTKGFAGVAKSFAGVFAAGAVINGIKSTSNEIDNLIASANKLNVSVQGFQFLEYAAKRSDVEIGTLEQGLGKLRLSLTDVSKADTFAKLGLDAGKLSGMDLDKAYISVAEAIGAIKSPAEQARAAVELFGKSGQSQLNLIRNNVGDLQKEFEGLHIKLSDEDVKSFDKFDKITDQVGVKLKFAFMQATIAMIPFINTAVEGLNTLLPILMKVAEGYKLLGTLGPQSTNVNGKPLLDLNAAQALINKKNRQTTLQNELHNTNSFTKENVNYFKRNLGGQPNQTSNSTQDNASSSVGGAGIAALQAGSNIAKLGAAAAGASASLGALGNINLKELLGITPASGKDYLSSILTTKTQATDETFTQLANELRDNVASGTQGFGSNNETKLAELNSIARNTGQGLGVGETNSGMVAAVKELETAIKGQSTEQQVRVIVSVKDGELVSAVVDDTKFIKKVQDIARGITSKESNSTAL